MSGVFKISLRQVGWGSVLPSCPLHICTGNPMNQPMKRLTGGKERSQDTKVQCALLAVNSKKQDIDSPIGHLD